MLPRTTGRSSATGTTSVSRQVRDAEGEPPGDESEVALYWRSFGFDYAREHVGELPRVVALRVLRQWELFRPLQNVNLGGIEGRNRDASTMGLMMFYGLAGLSVVGAVSMRRRRIPLMPLGVQFLVGHDHIGVHVRQRAVPRTGRDRAVRARCGGSRASRRVGAALARPRSGRRSRGSRRSRHPRGGRAVRAGWLGRTAAAARRAHGSAVRC